MQAVRFASADGAIDVWRFDNHQPLGGAPLADHERAAADRFVTPAHRAAYRVQRVIVRRILARYLGVDPWQLAFTRGARGKPALAGLAFSLAHADDVGLLAVARHGAVGVDLESRAAAIDARALGRLVLAPDEHGADFLRIWCRKEACLKATGQGLLDDLTSVSVIADRVALEGLVLYVQDLAIEPGHVAALATTLPIGPVSPVACETVTW